MSKSPLFSDDFEDEIMAFVKQIIDYFYEDITETIYDYAETGELQNFNPCELQDLINLKEDVFCRDTGTFLSDVIFALQLIVGIQYERQITRSFFSELRIASENIIYQLSMDQEGD